MKIKILLWSIGLILIIGLAAGAYWWMSRPQVIIFSDDAKVTLLAVQYGKHHAPPTVKASATPANRPATRGRGTRSTRTSAALSKKMELAQEKLRLAEARGVPFVAVINYDSAWREPFAEWAEKQRWDLVIADEAHRIKAPGGKASMFFKRLRNKALHRVLLTGTPMQQDLN